MNLTQKRLPFDALTVNLSGSNLIEASAGTGKTYSIAILVLRLIVEKKIPIQQILMVTFTKAAVAELEERIRLFIRLASQYVNREPIEDITIKRIVDGAINQENEEEIAQRIKEAVLFLDETSVMTIHSFCQQTLTEFAFETDQLFGSELLSDTQEIIETEVNKFWRKHVTSIPVPLLDLLVKKGIEKASITEIVKLHLQGKHYLNYEANQNYTLDNHAYISAWNEIEVSKNEEIRIRETLLEYIRDNKESLAELCSNNSYTRKAEAAKKLENPDSFLDYILENIEKKNILKAFGDSPMMKHVETLLQVEAHQLNLIQDLSTRLYFMALQEIIAGVNHYKRSANQMGFDDLIENLHAALVGRDNQKTAIALQKKYPAVFIDEFQDTDRIQYEIFQKAFGKSSILFYIGDPKQSIYAWRKADIFTYFKAYHDVDHLYDMNVNYRSSASMIEAMNHFFLPRPGFDTFYFEKSTDSIEYVPVKYSERNRNKDFYKEGKPDFPITIFTRINKVSEIADQVAVHTLNLLNNAGYTIGNCDNPRRIRPSDIGILVRTIRQAQEIQMALGQFKIPYVTVSDSKIMQSDEALELQYLMEAIHDPGISTIKKALLSSIVGYGIPDILELDYENIYEAFKGYRTIWETKGIYAAFTAFLADFDIQKKLLDIHTENGERIITNLYQLLEILHKKQSRSQFSQIELIDWLKRNIEEDNTTEDEWLQRIENDEDAVKIVTIHRSKGLEYNIVLAPHLDFSEPIIREVISFRDEATSNYISVLKPQLSDRQRETYKMQGEQENRRLLYVAITRAVYRCYLWHKPGKSTLKTFIDAIDNKIHACIEFDQELHDPIGNFYVSNSDKPIRKKRELVQFSLLQPSWQRMSYSSLAAESKKIKRLIFSLPHHSYEEFVFNRLTKGNITGNLLHFIFEHVHFAEPEKWPSVIEEALRRYGTGSKEDYQENLPQLLHQVMNAEIATPSASFSLSDVLFDKRIHELEFDFPVGLFHPKLLSDLSEEGLNIQVKAFNETEGIMNGKIDLFFEHEGKYYVLDWKSTYLGNQIEEYAHASLQEAMNDNNYHLQYLIYTIAVKKYLESRMTHFNYENDFGGVLYLFVRGMRAGKQSGIYFTKPDYQTIQKLELFFSEVSP